MHFGLSDNVEILSYGLPRNDFFARQIDNTSEYDFLRKKFGFEERLFLYTICTYFQR